ncbi:hypothetical protein [Streptomyces brasiliensis]|uniref:Uncharacterized protein n=1 Tax=Streptomyces brasiliensis TaxID=1954 RepID=A0A917P2H1_9ACTN|nr:hypothetical protein [Streptomyces brasiliensis]GGJ56392.1 hypothetical protein GCM10010121_078710 [Streptomyces brasiliensis]
MSPDPSLNRHDSSEVPMFATCTGQAVCLAVVLSLAATLAFAIAAG